MRLFRISTAVAMSLTAALFGCTPAFEPEPNYAFHQAFVLRTAHNDQGCDSCHVLAAFQQGLTSTSETGWVTPIDGASCANCHPFVQNLEDPNAFCPPDNTNPLYDTEKCRYERAHEGPDSSQPINPISGCTGCHSDSDAAWVDEDVNPHLNELLDVFPLIAGHDGPGCADCHTPGQEALQQGWGDICGNCHGRTRDGADEGDLHYPPARAEWVPGQDESERDCKACHQPVAVDGSVTWPEDWDVAPTEPQNHGFLVPHHTVSTWAVLPATLEPENEWKYQCWSCHNTQANPTDGPNVQANQEPPNIVLSFATATCTNGCHGDAHNPTQTCYQAGCHEQAGPDDSGTPPPPL